MAINFRGYLYDDSGTAIQGATVQLLEQDGDQEASTTTDSNGLWYFNEADQDTYDIKITRGSSIRYIQWDDQISLKEIDVRNDSAATTPALTATNLTNSTANQVAVFSGANTTRADGDEIYLSFKLANSAGDIEEFARMTADAVDVTDGSEDGQIRFGVSVGGTMTDVFTINSTTAGSTDMTLDVSGDLTLDADGGDILFKDGGTTFGSATNTSGNLIIKSGTTTALTFSGANVTAAGTIGSGAITSTGIVTGTGFTAGNAVLAEAELELLDGLTAGTAIASKVVTTDANIDTTGQRNLTITGELDAATLDISGNSDFDGTLDVAGNTVISAGTFTVGSDGSGQDVVFYSGTSGDNLTWDSSEEVLQITGTNGATALDVLDGDVRVVDKLYFYDRGGEYLSSDGSTLTITGATTVSGGLTSTAASNTLGATSFNDADITNVGGIALDTITSDGSNIGFGTDGSGEDVYFYSATSGDHMFWDASDEKLVITGTDGQNSLEVADGNVTITDNLTVSGNFTVSGTTTTVDTTNLTVTDPLIKLAHSTTASPANDLGIIFTRGNGSSTNIANRAILWDESADQFAFAFTNDEAGTTTGNVDIDDYADVRLGALVVEDTLTIGGTNIVTGSLITTLGTITAGVWNGTKIATGYIADDAITSALIADDAVVTAAIADDAVVTASIADNAITNALMADDAIDSAEIADGAIDLAHMSSESVDEDNLYISNAGSNGQFLSKQSGNNGGLTWATPASTATAADDIADGDGAVNILTTSGNITIDAQANDTDVIIKVDDNGSSVTAVTFDGSDEGNAIFVNDVQLKSDGALLEFGADLDTTLTHTDGSGLTLNSTNKIMFNDSSQFIQGSSATVLSLGATDEIDLTATAIDLNGTLNVSGVLTTQSTIELGHASDTTLARSASGVVTIEGNIIKTVGTENMWVPAAAMTPRDNAGCAAIATVAAGTNGRPDFHVLDFDKDSDEHAQFMVAMPKSWDGGNIYFYVYWIGIAATTGVSWAVQVLSLNDNEEFDQAYGTAVVVDDDSQGDATELLISAKSGAIACSGADSDLLCFQVFRDVSDSNDDMNGDARLVGLLFEYTTEAATDA